jgi:enoyl-CoA hydratase/carnithine racemase
MGAELRWWTVDVADRIAVVTFVRPPKNWMSLAAMTELADLLPDLAARTDDVSVVVLTGGVDGYFIAHADLDDLAALGRGEAIEGDPRAWRRALAALESMPQPTVAAIDGQAWGGGCETALACTLRVGSERAHLGQPEVSVGIIPGAGGTQRLPRLVGPAVGAELCVTGRIVAAEEALRIGLLNAVLPTEGFLDEVRRWCGRITRNPAAAVFAAKRAVVDGLRLPLEDGLDLESRLFAQANASPGPADNASVPHDRPRRRDPTGSRHPSHGGRRRICRSLHSIPVARGNDGSNERAAAGWTFLTNPRTCSLHRRDPDSRLRDIAACGDHQRAAQAIVSDLGRAGTSADVGRRNTYECTPSGRSGMRSARPSANCSICWAQHWETPRPRPSPVRRAPVAVAPRCQALVIGRRLDAADGPTGAGAASPPTGQTSEAWAALRGAGGVVRRTSASSSHCSTKPSLVRGSTTAPNAVPCASCGGPRGGATRSCSAGSTR